MNPILAVFEDHTASHFRPLSASVPVYELRCGILNLRERLARLTGKPPVLLPRSHLGDLAALGGLAPTGGALVGADALAEAIAESAGRRLLAIGARVGADWRVIDALLAAAQDPQDWSWRDDDGLLAVCLGGEHVAAFLEAWRAWDDVSVHGACWRDPRTAPPIFAPEVPVATPRLPVAQVLPAAWQRLWDLVGATGPAIAADAARLGERGLPPRQPWGVLPDGGGPAPWTQGTALVRGSVGLDGVTVLADGHVYMGDDVVVAPGVVIDASAGPVVIDRRVRVMPQCYLEGPLYIGPGSVVKAGARIYGETSLGAVNRVAGEIGESTFLDFVNKQHDGFIGHAYLGSWVNLGAMTTCSDLKNNYGPIRVDDGSGPQDTGLQFLGLLAGEHVKTAIGTLLNTATCVGFASNVFATGFPPKTLPMFTWGDGRGTPYDVGRALDTAEVVLGRRGCQLTDAHGALFRYLAGA